MKSMSITEAFELLMVTNVENQYTVYEGWSGRPCGRFRIGGNALLLSMVAAGCSTVEQFYSRREPVYSPEAVEEFARRLARRQVPKCFRHMSWRLELPVLSAIVRIKQLGLTLSAREISRTFDLSIPRSEFVEEVIKDDFLPDQK